MQNTIINGLGIDIVQLGDEKYNVSLGNGIIYIADGLIKKIMTVNPDGSHHVTFIK